MITLDDLITRFGETELIEITDHDHYQAIDESVANTAINDAISEIASYLGGAGLLLQVGDAVIYAYGNTPKSLQIKACDIARYYLYENKMTETVEKRYLQAIDWLKMIQKRPSLLSGMMDNGAKSGGVEVIPNSVPSIYDDLPQMG